MGSSVTGSKAGCVSLAQHFSTSSPQSSLMRTGNWPHRDCWWCAKAFSVLTRHPACVRKTSGCPYAGSKPTSKRQSRSLGTEVYRRPSFQHLGLWDAAMPPLANCVAFQKPAGRDCRSYRFGLRTTQHPSSHMLGVAIVWCPRFFKDSLLQENSLC